MPMNALEVAVYAMVLSLGQPAPFECVAVQPSGVNCTNGYAVAEDGPGVLAYGKDLRVIRDAQGRVRFSDGTTTHFDASAWVSFKSPAGKTLVSVRRTSNTRFRFSNGYTCEAVGDPMLHARCVRP